MLKLLKDILKPVYLYLSNKKIRELYRLYDKYGRFKRYVEVENLRFLNYVFVVPDVPSFIWQFKEIFVDEIYKFKSNSYNPIIYDCGANVGVSVAYFKELYPNAIIKAFEADPYIGNILEKNLEKNGLYKNVEIIKKAVWINNDKLEFSKEGADGGSIYGDRNKTIVNAIRLKELIEKEKKIDMLKIDIEGAEYEVLKDCSNVLNKVDNLFVEYHSWSKNPQRLSEILSILEKNNFRYYIESLTKRKHPFISGNKNCNMDLQLNIFGVREKT